MKRLVLLIALVACGSKESKSSKEPAKDEHADENGEHADEEKEGAVHLTKEQLATAKIALATVTTRAARAEISATAEVVAPDNGIARIGSKISGRITKLPVSVGDMVKAGQLIAVIDSPELATAKSEYLSAAAQARLTRETADREKILFDKKISAEQDYRVAEAEASKARAAKEAAESRLHTLGFSEAQVRRLSPEQHSSSALVITTPIAGVVVERPVTLGQVIQPEDTVGVVMDLRTVWLQVDAHERDLAQIAVGQQVTAYVTAWPERAFVGDIQLIGAVVERATRTVKVRVVVPNPDGALKPGMFATVRLAGTKGEVREGLFVPSAAVQRDGENAIVFVPTSEEEFQLREVETGVITDGFTQITKGLAAGEKVVTTGSFQLKSEARRESFGGHEH